eukprot:CAMPEP_0114335604 /NCGR_PEP_ID=MMETSP0101-20121206/5160_1 /TAXON_ID=38822 ORGANISM="Pteridomonas danica, Strain PT" /NCGR_SAMPLE_ID=MMETSP0101 /ASSEMBLY_ACC=CAM_ASM_000211 /LENGTH=74 /DNA_ID=CAMNT_0001467267 /DNA_START=592 /DNA_END=812 /DNA_ORIENTATION=-
MTSLILSFLRKSKRERSGGRIRLPGEAISDDESSNGKVEALPLSQALSRSNKQNKNKSSSSLQKTSGSSNKYQS